MGYGNVIPHNFLRRSKNVSNIQKSAYKYPKYPTRTHQTYLLANLFSCSQSVQKKEKMKVIPARLPPPPVCRAWHLHAQENLLQIEVPCTQALYAYRLNKALLHPRESNMHPMHPSFFTLHAQDLVEFCHALQTGLPPAQK